MRTLTIAAAAVSAVCALAPAAAWANCASVQPTAVAQVRVDPLDAQGPAELVQGFTLTFSRTGAGTAPVEIEYQIVDEDSAVRPRVGLNQGPTVGFQSRDNGKEMGVFRGNAFSSLQAGKLVIPANRPSGTAQAYLRVTDLRSDVAAGGYHENFNVRFRCSPDQLTPDEAMGVVNVSVVVPNVLSANIAGASTHGQIDFQDFSQRDRSLNISVRSTGPYQISTRSLGEGKMRREGAVGADAADEINYAVTLDGRPLEAGGAVMRMDRAGLAGRQFGLDVKVEPVDRKRAGLYADTLVVTLTPVN